MARVDELLRVVEKFGDVVNATATAAAKLEERVRDLQDRCGKNSVRLFDLELINAKKDGTDTANAKLWAMVKTVLIPILCALIGAAFEYWRNKIP